MDELIPWGGVTPLAIVQQLLARVKSAPREVYIVACVIEKNERGNYEYTCTSTSMPYEVQLTAVHELEKRVI